MTTTIAHAFDLMLKMPTAELVSVTPEIAEQWLGRNRRNRPFKKHKIAQYARDMAAGRWQCTGEAIKFDVDGWLLDGQNRLAAVIASGTTVTMFVIFNLASEAQEVMDSGAARSAADALSLRGTPPGVAAKDVTPSAVAYRAWTDGVFKHAMWQSGHNYTNSEILEILDTHPGIVDAVRLAVPVKRQTRLPIGALGAAIYRFTSVDPDATADYLDRIVNLRTSGKGDPISTLLKRVSEMRESNTRVWTATAIYFLARSWNAFRAGERLEKFQLGSEGRGWVVIPEPR